MDAVIAFVAFALLQAGLAGQTVALRLPDVSGKAVSVPLAGRKATVLLFVAVDCPVCNRYAPTMRKIRVEFEAMGVGFAFVYPNSVATPAQIAKHHKDFNLGGCALIDQKLVCTKAARAGVTPQAVVLDAKGNIVYRGAIDNLYIDHGQIRERVTNEYLRIALSEILAGKPVTVPVTGAIGCQISFK